MSVVIINGGDLLIPVIDVPYRSAFLYRGKLFFRMDSGPYECKGYCVEEGCVSSFAQDERVSLLQITITHTAKDSASEKEVETSETSETSIANISYEGGDTCRSF